MSRYYTAFQYDAPYKPTALRNWQIPKYFCPRARQRTGRTRIIANATGNLLPGVHRSDSSWGNFIGTWSMPRRIDRQTAAILNGSAEFKAKEQKCRLYYTAKPAQDKEQPKEEPKTETKAEARKEEIAKKSAEEVKAPEESQIGEEVAKEEVVSKPLCPIHDMP